MNTPELPCSSYSDIFVEITGQEKKGRRTATADYLYAENRITVPRMNSTRIAAWYPLSQVTGPGRTKPYQFVCLPHICFPQFQRCHLIYAFIVPQLSVGTTPANTTTASPAAHATRPAQPSSSPQRDSSQFPGTCSSFPLVVGRSNVAC